MATIYDDRMSSEDSGVRETLNEGMSYVDETIDTHVIEHIDEIVAAGEKEELAIWQGLLAGIIEYLDGRYNPQVAREVSAYAMDRVVARRSESPLFTDDLSVEFIKSHRQLPEGPAWLAYIKGRADPKELLDRLY